MCAVLAWATIFCAQMCLGQWAVPSRNPTEYDCGTLALRTILALEGRAVPVDAVRSALPGEGKTGRSMAELRDAARALGLTLMGVSLPRSDRAPDRPALVLLKREDHGHFVVVRPVGPSGRLIQIIDPNGDPIVTDAADVYASPEWTGLALIPKRPNWAFRVATSLFAVACSVCALRLLVKRAGTRNEDLDKSILRRLRKFLSVRRPSAAGLAAPSYRMDAQPAENLAKQ